MQSQSGYQRSVLSNCARGGDLLEQITTKCKMGKSKMGVNEENEHEKHWIVNVIWGVNFTSKWTKYTARLQCSMTADFQCSLFYEVFEK